MLEQKGLQTIGEIIGEAVSRKLLQKTNMPPRNEYIQKTKERIRSYPQLKRNIKRYQLDIENFKQENTFEKSKSVVIFQPTYREPLTIEDKRAAAIAQVERQMERDQREITYIELALEEIKGEEYYQAFELYFFQRKVFEEIAEELHKSRTVISRNVGRMINQLTVFFYGADAFQ